MFPIVRVLALSTVFAVTSTTFAADPVAWLPSSINAVARIKVAEVYRTPLAKKEQWIKKATESFVHQDALIPPGMDEIVMGAELNFADNLSSNGKYTVLVPEASNKIEKLSIWLPGDVEQIAGKPSVQFGHDGYILDAGDGCWLATTNSSRQKMNRWVKDGPSKTGSRLSPYLSSALTSKTNPAQLILAIDLQDNFSRPTVLEHLKEANIFSDDKAANSVADLVVSAVGVTISMTVDQERIGKVDLEFGKDAEILKPVLSQFVEGVLQRVGASSNDLTSWNWSVNGKRIIGTGPISTGGGRQLLSVLDPSSITNAISTNDDSLGNLESKEQKMGRISLKYSRSVRVLLDDLDDTIKRRTKDNYYFHDHNLFLERYGRKIDELPKIDVDPALIDFAMRVSSSLRYQAEVQKNSRARSTTRTAQYSATYATGYGNYYGNYYYNPNAAAAASSSVISAMTAQQMEGVKNVRYSEWKQIEDGFAKVRTMLTEKYNIEF